MLACQYDSVIACHMFLTTATISVPLPALVHVAHPKQWCYHCLQEDLEAVPLEE